MELQFIETVVYKQADTYQMTEGSDVRKNVSFNVYSYLQLSLTFLLK